LTNVVEVAQMTEGSIDKGLPADALSKLRSLAKIDSGENFAGRGLNELDLPWEI
jgi:hypothetical protein